MDPLQVTPEDGGRDQMAEASIELIVQDYYLGFQTAPYTGGIQKIGVAVTLSCIARGRFRVRVNIFLAMSVVYSNVTFSYLV